MNVKKDKISIYLLGCVNLFILFFITSCVPNKELSYTSNQISALNQRTDGIQASIDAKLSSINSNQAEMMVELDQLKEDIKQLAGRVEDNEHIIKHTVEKDLGAQDSIRDDLAKLADFSLKMEKLERILKQQQEYLGLKPLDLGEAQDKDIEAAPDGQAVAEKNQEPKESDAYDIALSLFREEKYEQALAGLKEFLNNYPKSDLADNAQFWIGECLMALKQYERAILAYQDVVKNYPNENKVPNAMLRQAIAFLEINDKTSSKLLLKKVIKQFPNSSEAAIAQKKLMAIK